MTQQKKPASAAPKPPKKLIPRTAPKTEVSEPLLAPVVEILEPVIKPVVETAAEAHAIKQPLGKPSKAKKEAKPEKPLKTKKIKLVRDSYAMPDVEYAQIALLKKRLAGLGLDAKKSELLRAGIALLAALNEAELKAVMANVERIKTGRPAK